jgi:hypothetical protein
VDGSLDGIDWDQAKADLTADDFDNGRSERRVADDTQGQLGPWRGGLAHQHPRAQAGARSS